MKYAVVGGYLTQVSTADALRHAMAVAHWISSGAFVAAYVAHILFMGRRRGRRRPTEIQISSGIFSIRRLRRRSVRSRPRATATSKMGGEAPRPVSARRIG